MKKIIILFILTLFIIGCNSKNKEVKKTKKETRKQKIVDTYKDLNNTKIGIYQEKQNKIELVTEYKTNIESGIDIGVFQIYPSNDKEVILENGFGNSFYNKWVSNNNYKNLKIGFNLKYTLDDNTQINHTILNPSTTITNKYIFTYLYDDYKNRNLGFYSHIEDKDYDEDSLFTSIKLYADDVKKLNSKIIFTVFTYDTENDFENSNYRGNSSYQITICDINKTC